MSILSTDRCVDGRLMRHRPFPDDPEFEADAGRCPRCQGRGCDRSFVYVCSNRHCGSVFSSDPEGHCPTCRDPNTGGGWSTMRREVLDPNVSP